MKERKAVSALAYQKIKKSGKLPSPNGVALELLRLVDDPAMRMAQIAEAVAADPATASRLLQLVNSPLSGVSRTIASVSMAVKLLGMHAVKNLALGISLLANNRSGSSAAFDFERYWSESLARAVAARGLVSHMRGCPADEAFTVALLGRIGQLALMTAFPGAYNEIVVRVGCSPSPELFEAELAAFGINQNDLSANMMADWRLADILCEAVRRQDRVDEHTVEPPDRASNIAELLHLAGKMGVVLAKSNVYAEDLLELMDLAEARGLETDAFGDCFNAAKEEWKAVAAIFSVKAQEVPQIQEMHTRASRHQGNILVVDDDPSTRHLISRHLTTAGYAVLTASDGREALRLIHSEGIRLVIMDWMMPEMDGLQLCRAVRESEATGFVYLIVLTGQTHEDRLAEAFEAGADDFLTKPCKKQELLSRLKAGVRTLALEEDLAAQQRASHKINAELATLNDQLEQMATTDELTGLFNRREAMRRLEDQWSFSERQDRPLACMMLDIDHFKKCNDTYGHDAGDEVLRKTAHILKRSVRTGETVCRIGGEEFVVFCPGATAEMASKGAERLRAAVEANQVAHGNATLSVTISAGVAERGSDTPNFDDLLKRADQALYEAKDTGRNRVCVAVARRTSAAQDPVHARAPLAQATPHAQSSSGSGAEVVLVVDEDTSIRALLRQLLDGEGLEVHEARDGLEAIDKAAKLHPALILIDKQMPNLNGLKCAQKLQEYPEFNEIPVTSMGTLSDRERVDAMSGAGIGEQLARPVHREELLHRVRAMIATSHDKADLLQSNSVRGEQARAMGLLFDLSRSLATADGLSAIFSQTVTSTAELLNCHRVSVMIPDAAKHALVVADAVGIEEASAEKIQVPVGSGIAGRVYESGASVILNEPGEVPGCHGPGESEFFSRVPLVSKALVVQDQVVGVLNVTQRHDGRFFEPNEIEYLDLICNMSATAIEQLQSRHARENAYAAIVVGLAKLAEHRDLDTGKHLERVTEFALLLAQEYRRSAKGGSEVDDRFLEYLKQAIPLHDIGKVSVPDAVLLKPGKLTEDEFAIMKRHAVVGANALQSVIDHAPEADFLNMARDIAYCHHEKFDGSGYPRGLVGCQIPLSARIAAVADAYDALRGVRPYKKAFSHEKSASIIRETSGTHFDPEVVEVFLRLGQEFCSLSAKLADHENKLPRTKPPAVLVAGST